ncbi:hypothetical protein ABFV62_26075, partial [Pseudomonas syringae]
MVYSRWRRKLPAWLQVRPVELPGRGARMAEPLHTDMLPAQSIETWLRCACLRKLVSSRAD